MESVINSPLTARYSRTLGELWGFRSVAARVGEHHGAFATSAAENASCSVVSWSANLCFVLWPGESCYLTSAVGRGMGGRPTSWPMRAGNCRALATDSVLFSLHGA